MNLPFRLLVWALPVQVALYGLEASQGLGPIVATFAANVGTIDPAAVDRAFLIAFALAFAAALLASRTDAHGWPGLVTFLLQAMLPVHAAALAIGTVLAGAYLPGTATLLLVATPATLVIFNRAVAEGRFEFSSLLILFVLAATLTFPLAFICYRLAATGA